MSCRSKKKCNGRSSCQCVKCCEPEPQCKVIVCPQVTCVLQDPDADTELPVGTITLNAATGNVMVVTDAGPRQIALV